MATYSITEDKNYPWVKLITIKSNYDIDVSNDLFNITVKDQLEYFVAKHIHEGSTFELEELYKKDTYPTLEISNYAIIHEKQKCFDCNGTLEVTCTACNGKGYFYSQGSTYKVPCTHCGGHGEGYTPIYGSGKTTCPTCSGYAQEEQGYAHTECDDELIYTDTTKSTIFEYQNSDDDTLIKNGIQFWVDGVGKRTMYIRVVSKGISSSNRNGYQLWHPIDNDYYNSGYVGFAIALFNITLNKNERLNFSCYLLPKVEMGDPIPEQLDKPISEWDEYPHVLSGAIRTDFDWNDAELTNQLYVNNGTALSSYEYTQKLKNNYDWETELNEGPAATATPLYVVKSSAYLSDWLINQETLDLYDSTDDDPVSSVRGFDFTSGNANSYLYDELAMTKVKLNFDWDKHTPTNTVFIESNGQTVSDELTCYEITQKIEDSSCSGMIRKNQVKLELEI